MIQMMRKIYFFISFLDLQDHAKTNLASEKSSMLAALACTNEVWLLSRLASIKTCFDDSLIVTVEVVSRNFTKFLT